MNFKNAVYLFFVFGIFRELLVPHTKTRKHNLFRIINDDLIFKLCVSAPLW